MPLKVLSDIGTYIFISNFFFFLEWREEKSLPNIHHTCIQGGIFGVSLLVKTSSLPKWFSQLSWLLQFQCPVTKNVQNDLEMQVELYNIFSYDGLWISIYGTLCSANKDILQVTTGSAQPGENVFLFCIKKHTHANTQNMWLHLH